ncbi:MAG: hypothetical protein ACTSRC_07380 [Candidatus Helarchaeota archaeon]
MKVKVKGVLLGLTFLIFVMNFIPLIEGQTLYQSYFWIADTKRPLSVIGAVGDLDADHVQLSEVAVGGQGNITILDGFGGTVLANYSISVPFSYDSMDIGNLDADLLNEIVVGSSEGNSLITLDYNATSGTLSKDWEKSYNVTQIRVVDITNDSINEVIISDLQGNLTVFDKDGVLLWFANFSQSIKNFQCVDFSQDNKVDKLLVFFDSSIALLDTNGTLAWQASLTSIPLNGLVGDVTDDSASELIVKGQNMTYCLTQAGTILWNSSVYETTSPGLLLYNSSDSLKFEILIAGNNGSYLLNGTTGAVFRQYLSNSTVTTIAIGPIFGESYQYLVMGDVQNNLTIWVMEPVNDVIYLIMNITLSGPVVDLYLTDMNADGIPDMVIGTSNGMVYVIGVPWLINFNYVLIGIGIGAIVIVISIVLVMRYKAPSKPPEAKYHIK